MLTAEGRLEEAYEISSATNSMPEICGRICPKDRLCEGNCVIEKGLESVAIGAVERYITDTAFRNGWIRPPQPMAERPQSVGIVGAGPGGMTVAEEMRRLGYRAHVYDRYDRVGGLLIYGIPNFKLEKTIVQRRADLLTEGGVEFHLNVEVGRDVSLAELRARHDAVVIATGAYKARDASLPGIGLGNIFQAMDYLTASNRKGLGDAVPTFDDDTLGARGRDVVVGGGGGTAMDCVRQGARSVRCLYRRDRVNMPGSMQEVRHAEEGGVEFVWLSQPEAVLGNSVVEGVRAVRIHLGVADASGRQTPQPIPGSSYSIDADLLIKALGFDPEDLPALFDEPTLKTTRWGTLLIDRRTMMTSLDGLFAIGDIVRGASLVVWAIKDGRDTARAIHRYIQANAGGGGMSERQTLPAVQQAGQGSGLYDPSFEHDSCGVGLIATLDGLPRRDVVEAGIAVLKAVWHRGAVDADGKTGDGDGIHVEIPQDFFRDHVETTGQGTRGGRLAVGMVFLPKTDLGAQDVCRSIVETEILHFGHGILGWRQVPIDSSVIGEKANASRPEIEQVIIANKRGVDDDQFEIDLYITRRRIEKQVLDHHITGFYICSLSCRSLIYKGMFLAEQLTAFYPDLLDERFVSRFAIFHQRYSTNTFPTWRLAQPFRMLAHNGEINTVRGNKNWMASHETRAASDVFGPYNNELFPLIEPESSDSMALDAVLEGLVRAGRSVPAAYSLPIPDA